MKRNLLAIAIPALLVAGAANAAEVVNKDGTKLDVYGRVNASNYLIDDAAGTSSARLGLKGSTKISDGVSAYGHFEWQTKQFVDSTATIDNRYAFAGLNFGDIGSLDYGKNNGVVRLISYYTDVLPEFGGDSEKYIILGNRTANVLTYSNSNLFGAVDGLSFALQYADKKNEKIGADSITTEAYGANVQYAILDTGLKVGAGYARADKDNSFIVGLNYDANNVYFGAVYDQTKVGAAEYKGYEAVIGYGIDFEVGRLTPSVAYISHQKDSADVSKYVDLGLQYAFNKNVTALVDYQLNLLKDKKDQVALGLIYKF